MASTYVNDLRLNEMATGDGSGTWGTTTNTNLELIAEAFGVGSEAITTNADTHSTTIADGATDPGRALFLNYTGTLDSTCTVSLLPNTVSKVWIIENATSGGFGLSMKQGSGAEVVIPNGHAKIIYSDGAGSGAAIVDAMTDIDLPNLIIKNPATSASPGTLLLQTGDTDVAAADVLGKIQFQAPDEATGTDAILVAAEIAAVSEGDFSSSNNATKLSFKTGASEAATEKMTLSSGGDLTIATGGDLITATAGTANVRVGVNAGSNIESGGNYNVVIGNEAGNDITTGDNNVAIGYIAFDANTTGSNNTALGYATLTTNTTAAGNTAVGSAALQANTTGINNTATGYNALYSNTTGNANVATGQAALFTNTTGISNTATGYNALYYNTTASYNTASGQQALAANTTGASNDAAGYAALFSNTTGYNNIASGHGAMYTNTTGYSNIALGYTALYSNTSGIYNTVSGHQVMYTNTIGHYNTASGSFAMYANTDGQDNACAGYSSLRFNTTGYQNVAMGAYAMYSNTTGYYNAACGRSALSSNTTGIQHVAVGRFALYGNTTGLYNTGVGYYAGGTLTTGSNNTCLGNGAQAAAVSSANSVTLGNTSISALRCQVALTVLSDKRDKEDIEDLPIGLDFINTLRPVKFTWNMRDGAKVGIKEAGFIAQDLDASQQEFDAEEYLQLVLKDNPDKLEASPTKLVPMLVKAVQELSAEVEKLKEKLNDV